MRRLRWTFFAAGLLFLSAAARAQEVSSTTYASPGPEEQYVLDKLAEARQAWLQNNTPPEVRQQTTEAFRKAAVVAKRNDAEEAAKADIVRKALDAAEAARSARPADKPLTGSDADPGNGSVYDPPAATHQ